MYTDKVPTFVIDLDKEEYKRWNEVIEADIQDVIQLVEEADEGYEHVPSFLKTILGGVVSLGYKLYDGRYQGELRAWADALGRPMGDIVLMNCSYEMSHASAELMAFGCTAGIRWAPKMGLVHVRNLDWPLNNIGLTTRLFEFKKGKRSFFSVGISGYTGVLSGMLPGAYSATINWAPPNGYPKFDFGPSFLLREVFETCDTYGCAVDVLANTPLSTPVFFTVCGAKRGEACVIERTHGEAVITEINGDVIVHGNHHVDDEFYGNNSDEKILESSIERVEALEKALMKTSVNNIEEIAKCLDIDLVLNDDTCQQMAFCPETGDIRIWRWVD